MDGWNKRAIIICSLALILLIGCLQEAKEPVTSLADAKACVNESSDDRVQQYCEFDSIPSNPEQNTDTPPPERFPESPKPTDIKTPTTFSTVSTTPTTTSPPMTNPNVLKATFYKSTAPCRCCDKYFDYIATNGFQVTVVENQDMTDITSYYQIPHDMESCHTAVIEDYFVEGHVPIEAINKLLSERPEIDGIALPGKPYGSPGRRGAKTGKFTIYALSDGEPSIFLIL